MKRVKRFIIGAFLLPALWLPLFTAAQWIPAEGIWEAGYTKLAVITDSTLVIAPIYNGIWTHPLGSGEWTQVLSEVNPRDLKKNDEAIFCCSHPVLYRSFDKGYTWDTLPLMPEIWGSSIAVLDSVLFSPGNNDIFRSDDYGQTFYSVKNNLPDISYCRVFANEGTVILFVSSSNQIFISENLGLTWYPVSMNGFPMFVTDCFDITRQQDKLWLAGYDGFSPLLMVGDLIFGGWESSDDPLNIKSFTAFHDTLFAGGRMGVYWYDNASAQWIGRNNGIEYQEIQILDVTGQKLLAGSSTGPYLTDNSYSWSPCSEGLNLSTILRVVCQGEDVWALTRFFLYHSSDQGMTFEQVDLSSYASLLNLAVQGSSMYISSSYRFLESYNLGLNWSPWAGNTPYWMSLLDLNQEYIFCSNQDVLYRTSRFEPEWVPLPLEGLSDILHLAVNETNVLVSGFPTIFRSMLSLPMPRYGRVQ